MFDFLKNLLGIGTTISSRPDCPHCGFEYSWNGRRCSHCHFPHHQPASPSSTDGLHSTAEIVNAELVTSASALGAPPRQSKLINGLDVEKFAPLSMDQALSETSGANWKNAYFDSLHVIPSADLARVRVIDQTMVGLGLISSAELAQIHAIGAEFETYRSDQGVIETAGARAVLASREERERLKQQKKAESAARKEARAAAVQHRRATDIVFLGRGVSKGLADRRSHIERLTELQLPVLATPAELATAMQLTIPRLRWLAFHSLAARRVHYIHFTIPKKSGGLRNLSAPHSAMAAAQRWIFENVLQKISPHENAHGFVSGQSIVTNARPHIGADILINVDLKDFFSTITFWRTEGLFRSCGYSPAVATIMALICTECPRQKVRFNGTEYYAAIGPRGLPQGACTSPAISNLVSRHMDLRLTGMANKLGWNYTRYADDISFSIKFNAETTAESANKTIGYLLARIRHITDDEGFSLNEKKTRVLRSHAQQSVTGIVVNDRLSVARKKVRQLRAILNNAKRHGLESQNRDNRDDFAAWLNGMISFVEMVNADQGRKLRSEFDLLL